MLNCRPNGRRRLGRLLKTFEEPNRGVRNRSIEASLVTDDDDDDDDDAVVICFDIICNI